MFYYKHLIMRQYYNDEDIKKLEGPALKSINSARGQNSSTSLSTTMVYNLNDIHDFITSAINILLDSNKNNSTATKYLNEALRLLDDLKSNGKWVGNYKEKIYDGGFDKYSRSAYQDSEVNTAIEAIKKLKEISNNYTYRNS